MRRVGAVQLLGAVTAWMLEVKVRSRALLFVFRVRSKGDWPGFFPKFRSAILLSRLPHLPSQPFRSLAVAVRPAFLPSKAGLFSAHRDQFALIQLFSSSWVVIFYPASMSRPVYRLLCVFGYDKSREAHRESCVAALYCERSCWLTL